jgi:tetratricopeptide (TPR) repeat protein
LDYFKLCDTVVAGPYSKTSKKQRLGTWARTKYSLGLVYREQYELQKAIAYFTESAELAYQSFLADRGSKLVPVAIARSLGMGLASIHATLGRPDLAVPLLMSAKAMLPESEILISTHIDLIRAALPDWVREPRMSRPQVSKLKELSRCHGVFSKRPPPHPVYRARAAYYLARECVQQAQLQQQDVGAPKGVELLKKSELLLGDLTLASSGDLRFELLGVALRSHIARINSLMFKDSKGVDRAVELATWGLQQTDDKRHPSVFVELVNARGLARMLQGNFRSAIDDFTSAMNLGARANNHRLCAASLLRLSQAYLQVGSTQEAASCFNKFREREPALHVRTADVALLAEETERMMAEKGQDFVLTLASNFDPEMIQDEFRRFLVRWARSKTSSDKGAAEKLGIARQTLYQWVQK